MAAANWTLDQVLGQLNSGNSWSGDEITYSFPRDASQFIGWDEADGFVAMNDAQIEIVEYALAGWDELIAADFTRVDSGSDIEIAYTTTGIDYAHAYFPGTGSVWFNSDYDDVKNPVVAQYGYGTIIHELGHALGLDHMGEYNGEGEWAPSSYQDSTVLSIMSYFGPDHFDGEGQVMWADWEKDGQLYSPQTAMLNDIMAIQHIYGVETSTRLGDTVYGFNSNIVGAAAKIFDFTINENPILAIFDSGGRDTLDFSGFLSDSVISLVSGTYSAVNEMTNNIAIAYNAVIENAVGGAGDDELIGNDIANMLRGGAGDDLLKGGAGTDTAIFSGAASDYAITANDDGSYAVRALGGDEGKDTLIDIEKLSFSDGEVNLTGDVVTNSAPVLASAIADIQAEAGTNFLVEISPGAFEDPDGDPLTYSATLEDGSDLPDWLSFDPQTLTFNVAPGAGDVGAVSVRVTASDGKLTASDLFAIVVDEANTAPEITADIAAVTEGKTVLVDVLANDVDADDDGLTLMSASVVSANGTAVMEDGQLRVAYEGMDLARGEKAEIDVVYMVTDGSAMSEGSLTVTVNGVWNTIRGTAKRDTLFGTDSDDFLQGFKGNDTIYAFGGNDTLDGGGGSDTLWGDFGADTFRFASKSGRDIIFDFTESDKDRIDLSRVSEISNYRDLVKNHLKDEGDAVIRISNGNSITLDGVDAGGLDRGDFIF
ncbi:M10 family metallopeptidase C-terminal domain-containing protein [Rhizobium sp. TRM95796]|uniref:M10 family metallopeptidase C-terminal domain-containing protein n=1 Tax=Rhizobium sp. TRM95796 TaxID=2979862 RepID=UPI0021E947A1|nr:M10 family metallopeptidase C-terminal domain-containing protein [Rhizobium sp. TRM95796]MCV3764546.1 M10 family metallopeptidase C-terminal domain-containing protein [Rhizobium sp. TRM95796]